MGLWFSPLSFCSPFKSANSICCSAKCYIFRETHTPLFLSPHRVLLFLFFLPQFSLLTSEHSPVAFSGLSCRLGLLWAGMSWGKWNGVGMRVTWIGWEEGSTSQSDLNPFSAVWPCPGFTLTLCCISSSEWGQCRRRGPHMGPWLTLAQRSQPCTRRPLCAAGLASRLGQWAERLQLGKLRTIPGPLAGVVLGSCGLFSLAFAVWSPWVSRALLQAC